MHRLYVIVALLLNLFVAVLLAPETHAVSSSLVIYQVQAGGVVVDANDKTAATREFISIYNNSDQRVEISNWCITNKSGVAFTCFNPTLANEKLYLPAHAYATVSSDNFARVNNYQPDVNFTTTNQTSGSLVAGSDDVSLIDPNGLAVDNINWSTTLSGGFVLQRQFSSLQPDLLLDVDSASDFQKLNNLDIPTSGVEEWVNPDVCLNIDDIQLTVPDGYVLDGYGCSVEVTDVCLNLDGIQATLPFGYKFGLTNECQLDLLPIRITELLPNASGADDGNEFIEFYNPNAVDVNLSNYLIYIGIENQVSYSFPDGLIIKSGGYLSLTNQQLNFTLINSSSLVTLRSLDGNLIDESIVYDEPDEGMAWALIGDNWQYTNQPTPGIENLASLEEGADVTASNLQPCASNQYRSPETNRCRMLITSTGVLAACKDGQYRSEETNHCRNIVSDISFSLPCAEGQERNPATNRCRAISAVLGASTLAPCKEGQERNPETNRCRNVVSMPLASYTPEQIKINSRNEYIWWSFVGVSAVVVGYGVWEWRRELFKIFSKFSLPLHFKK